MYFRQKAPEKDITKPPPEIGAARFFFLLTTHFSKLLTLNLIFILFSLPIITIPSSLSGMNRVCMLLVREGACFVWIDFFNEFKASFIKSITLFLPNTGFILLACLCFFTGQRSTSQFLSFVLYALAMFVFILGLLLSCYSFSMYSLCKLSNRDIFRNAISLIFLEPKADLLLASIVGGIIILFIWFLPYSIPFALFGFFPLLSLIACVITYKPLKRRIVTKM